MNIPVKALKHAAPGPYLGFALQPVRFCFHLLDSPKGSKVSLEHVDDVAVHYADGSVTLEQTKSALRSNPLRDWSEDFWKTVANWVDALSTDKIPSCSKFRLYVTPPHQAEVAQRMSDASTPTEAAAFVELVKLKRAKVKKPKACESYLQTFFQAPADVRTAVVTQFALLNADSDPLDPLRAMLRPTVAPELIDLICECAIGMAKERADALIRTGNPGKLDADAFKANFITFVQTTNIPGLLSSFATVPADGDVTALLLTHPTFIRQLEIIETSEDDRVRAVSDFLRTSADKSKWAEAGLIHEGSLRDWDDNLVSRHGLICGEIADLHPDQTAVVRGRLVYRRCAQLQAPLDGRQVPGHFVHGCFNSLADVMRLGWHPDYRSLLDRGNG
jgi:C-terminal domain 7 of the ABC-three component (ABC-3C) systems